jgi:hypothetical protein
MPYSILNELRETRSGNTKEISKVILVTWTERAPKEKEKSRKQSKSTGIHVEALDHEEKEAYD